MLSVHDDLEMQMWTGRITAISHPGDLHPRGHTLADRNEEIVHMAVNGNGAVVVPDPYPQAESLGRARIDDRPIGNGIDWRADRPGNIDTAVVGTPAAAEAGGECAGSGEN